MVKPYTEQIKWRMVAALKSFFRDWMGIHPEDWDLAQPPVKQQENTVDCGIFAMLAMEEHAMGHTHLKRRGEWQSIAKPYRKNIVYDIVVHNVLDKFAVAPANYEEYVNDTTGKWYSKAGDGVNGLLG